MTTKTAMLSDLLAAALVRHAEADRTAFIAEGVEVSYADLFELVVKSQDSMVASGVDRGERVGLVVDKTVESIATFIGLLLMGGCPAFIDPRSSAELLVEQSRVIGLNRLICEPDRFEELASVSDGLLSIPVLREGSRGELIVRGDDPESVAFMLFTSGSTGRPKGVLISQGAAAAHASGVIERTRLTGTDVLLHLMPIFHTNGLNNQIIAPLLAGARVAIEKRFRPESAVQAVRRIGPTIVTGVPTMFLRMLPHVAPEDSFSSLRMLRCGSAPIKTEQVREIEAVFGVPVVLSYGMSEATCTSTMNPVERPKAGSVGMPLQGQAIRIARPGSIEPVESGSDGEVLIGGAALMSGYLGADGNDPIEAGWLHTGDLGHVDSEGYLTISGRLKDTIVRGGENISPATIEQALIRHPAVDDACVVAREHHDLGEVPVAYVSVGGPVSAEMVDELKGWTEQALSRSLVPADIQILDELPVTPVGKIDRGRLSALDKSVGSKVSAET